MLKSAHASVAGNLSRNQGKDDSSRAVIPAPWKLLLALSGDNFNQELFAVLATFIQKQKNACHFGGLRAKIR